MKYITLVRYINNRIHYFKNKTFSSQEIITGADDIKYHITPGSSLDYIIKKEGFLDDWAILRKLEPVIPKDGIIFDIGANVGHLSLPFAKKFVPYGHVYAYEPDPENSKQLTKNIELNKLHNIIKVTAALQNDEFISTIDFNIRRTIVGDGNQNKGLSSIKPIDKFKKNTLSVTASTVDNEAKRLHITTLSFIKIDVEGAEHLVLEGAKKSIEKWNPIIQYEYSNVLDGIMHEENTVQAFTILKSLGYKQFYVDRDAKLVELRSPNKNMQDVNIIAFPQGNTSYTKLV
jgi:FkbM family methyltransferase